MSLEAQPQATPAWPDRLDRSPGLATPGPTATAAAMVTAAAVRRPDHPDRRPAGWRTNRSDGLRAASLARAAGL